MKLDVKVRTSGGDRLRGKLNEARARSGEVKVQVGFFSSARYDDGTPVTNVAAWHEFGTRYIPERPFMRQAVRRIEQEGLKSLKGVDPTRILVAEDMANRVGAEVAGAIQRSIYELREPPLSQATISRRRNQSNNPLIDTGFMRQSVTWVIVKRNDKLGA